MKKNMEFKYFLRLIISFITLLQINIFAVPSNNKPEKIPKVQEGHILIKILTTMGTAYADLDLEKDPITTNHFLNLVDSGFYNNLIFHRIIQGFVIQTGRYTKEFEKKTLKTHHLPNQSKVSNEKNLYGTLSMARLKSDPDSASTEFFINLFDNPRLDATTDDYGYAVFGKIIKGMDVIEKISGIKTWKKNDLRYAPFFPNEALIKEISRVH